MSSFGKKLSWSGLVTALQIAQMFVGMAICFAIYFVKSVNQEPCYIADESYWAGKRGVHSVQIPKLHVGVPRMFAPAGLAMYSSYAALFVQFAVGRYLGQAERQNKVTSDKALAAAKAE